MSKLISAAEALEMSNSVHSVENAIELVNSRIKQCAQRGDFSAVIVVPHPEEIVDVVVERLKKEGYEVLYCDIMRNSSRIKVWWV